MPKRITTVTKKIPETWEDAMRDFLFLKQGQGVSPLTLRDYKLHITRFFTRFPDAYNPDMLRKRVLEYMSEPVMPGTFNLRREYLKAFLSWCVDEGIFQENPLDDIPKKKDPGKIRSLPAEVLQELFKLPDRKTFAGLRDYTLMILCFSTGIRPGEALALTPGDVNLKTLTVTVERIISKTKVERMLPIPPKVAEAIKELISVRPPNWGDDVPIFCTYSGTKMRVNDWDKRVEMYGKRLGLDITPYMLRHSFAIETLRGGANAFVVQSMLGHTTMNTTRRYIHLIESDIREAMEKANPLGRIMPQQIRMRKLPPKNKK